MRLTRFAISRPVITAMFFIGLAVYGLISYFGLGVNLYPNVAFPVVATIASYPGASPAEMEKLVIKPIEDQLDGMENLDKPLGDGARGLKSVVIARFKLDTDLNLRDDRRATPRRHGARLHADRPSRRRRSQKFSNSSDPIIDEAVTSPTDWRRPRSPDHRHAEASCPSSRRSRACSTSQSGGRYARARSTSIPTRRACSASNTTLLDINNGADVQQREFAGRPHRFADARDDGLRARRHPAAGRHPADSDAGAQRLADRRRAGEL